uniref:Retinoblastoma-like 1 (p107) n=1 Tax=Takifugu rubripes TaxID=31033 RepID=H2SIQ6_TAKRU
MREEQSLDSGSSRMEESSVRTVLEKLCQELNMDEQTATEAMQNFTAIWATHTLEGDVVHWLACSLYAACRKGSTPTVGKGLMEGNCVSLTRILRTSKLSLIQFFSKMRKWADMSNLSQNFRLRLKQLERNFEVSMVIFRKFELIFVDMFQNPQGEEPPRKSRTRKHRRLPCHITDVFKFCWTLFVYAKGNFCMIGDDLVNSYHLLLCCLDLVFGNALLCSNRKELINSSFKGGSTPQRRLCELHDGLVVEAKGIKQHYFKPYIQKLFEKQILKGNEEHLTELLDPQNFIENNKALNKEYEEYVLTVGDFDERVFLGADADEEIGTPRKTVRDSSSCQKNVEKPASLLPSTPLTGHAYLKENKVLGTPISLATQSVSRLQSMVAGLRTAPSENLMQIFKSCSRDPTESILARVKTLGKIFKEHYALDSEDMPTSHIDFAEKRLKLAEILYYKVLENVMVQEMKRLHGKDMSILLEQDIFHCSLMACCLEVVLFSYSSQRTFPWIINIFKLASFYFFKVIEVFIRSEEGLSRDMVKHLNQIEEQVLESQAWSTDSALWSALQAAGSQVPTVEEVRRSTVMAMRFFWNHQHHKLQPKPFSRALCLCLQVYHLASVRLRDLCWKLDISSDLRGKIWTCFEHTLIHCTDLMRGRHLDQLLLCSVYIMSKITKETHFFHDIMKCYRSQPQAHSHVGHPLVLEPVKRAPLSAEKTSQTSGDANVSQPGEEERGDLIQFYNSVFVLKVKNFALRYAVSDSEVGAPPLSPFPSVRAQPLSPRRVSQRHSLYVSPHKNSTLSHTVNSYSYRINSSPSEELTAINRIIQQGCVSRKRVFTIEGDVLSSASYSPTKRACSQSSSSPDVLLKRLQDVVSERQSH